MATVSTRLDDNLKAEAEKIADEIGIPLSTAINVFLKRFIANHGFPFSVVVPKYADNRVSVIDRSKLDAAVKRAVSDPANSGHPQQFTYLDSKTNKLITVSKEM